MAKIKRLTWTKNQPCANPEALTVIFRKINKCALPIDAAQSIVQVDINGILSGISAQQVNLKTRAVGNDMLAAKLEGQALKEHRENLSVWKLFAKDAPPLILAKKKGERK